MGYNAWKAGLVQAPRGLGSMASMMLIGQLARTRVDTRQFIGLGFTLMAIALWAMSGWNLQVGMWAVVIWPNALMGLGLGMIFPTAVRGRAVGRRSANAWAMPPACST